MSAIVELIPLALAAWWLGTRGRQEVVPDRATAVDSERLVVKTPFRDEALLDKALTALGNGVEHTVGSLRAQVHGSSIELVESDGDFDAHFAVGATPEEAERVIEALGVEYMRQLQQQNYDRLLRDAESEGLRVETDRVEGDDIVVVLRTAEHPRAGRGEVKVDLRSDGRVRSETYGLEGRECIPYIEKLERLMDAKAVESEYKPDFFVSQAITEISPDEQYEEE